MGRTKNNTLCVCGETYKDHQRMDLREFTTGYGIVRICPSNTSGIAPAVFTKENKNDNSNKKDH